ncbi:MAG: peptidase S53 [Terriglobia bacterium]|nr:MAG: peptidase S53 [Terriglobia bacterium]
MAFEKKVALAGSHRDPVMGAAAARPVDNNEVVHATLVLRRRTQTDSPEAFAYSPQTINHHTREEYGLVHGAAPADMATIEAFAHEYGLTVTERSQARRTVVLSGTAENMQHAFDTQLQHYESPHGSYRGRTGSIMIPEELQPILTAVLGLDNRPIAKPHIRIHASQPPGSLTPVQVAQLCNFPTNVNGAGQTIGIIELGGGFRTSDLKTYFRSLGITPPVVTAVSVDGGVNQPLVDRGADGEVMLDIEVAGAVAPGARIAVYFAPNTDQGFVDAISTAVHDTVNKPSVISISWGASEDVWTQQAANAMLQAVTDAAAVGVTVTAAAGDDGATDGARDNKLHVDLPACLPPVLACGGTRLNTTNGAFASEVVWNELANGEGATGGGVSKIFAIPDYQATAGVPKHPETGFAGRGVPDVAGDADPVTGYLVRVDGRNTVIGGTSAVSPLWAGLIALINQQLGRPVGFLHPAIYQIGSSAFRDITSGTNGHYAAGASWDACTGLGSPNGTALIHALMGKAAAAGGV